MAETKIEWADRVWNPVVGCTKVSPGCAHCYAERMAVRLVANPNAGIADQYRGVVNATGHWTGQVHLLPDRLEEPLKWRKPTRVFVNSMSDLFHERVPGEFQRRVFLRMSETPQHTYMILTKRPDRMKRFVEYLHMQDSIGAHWCDLFPNVWLGVSVEDQRAADERIPQLLQTPAAKRFVSCEPLLGPVDLTRWLEFAGCDTDMGISNPGIDWVIVGGESGPGARPMHPMWVQGLRDQCQAAGVPFFFKQWGEWIPKPQIAHFNSDATDPRRFGWCVDEEWLEVIKGKPWGTLAVDGTYMPNTTTWNGRQLSPGDNYECSGYRVGKAKAGRVLDGRTWEERPEAK